MAINLPAPNGIECVRALLAAFPAIKTVMPTEVKTISLIRQSLSTPQIVEKLFVGTETVKSHRKNIHCKLNITHLSELLDFAREHGL